MHCFWLPAWELWVNIWTRRKSITGVFYQVSVTMAAVEHYDTACQRIGERRIKFIHDNCDTLSRGYKTVFHTQLN